MGCSLSSSCMPRKKLESTVDNIYHRGSEDPTFHVENFSRETQTTELYSFDFAYEEISMYRRIQHCDIYTAKVSSRPQKRVGCDSLSMGTEDYEDPGMILKSNSLNSLNSLATYSSLRLSIPPDEMINTSNFYDPSWLTTDGLLPSYEACHSQLGAGVGDDSLDNYQNKMPIVTEKAKEEPMEWQIPIHRYVSINNDGITLGGAICQLTVGSEFSLSILGKELFTTQTNNETDLFGFFQK